jgi:hypothetical protein
MTVRDTSIEAYHTIKSSGLLGGRQKHAYSVLLEFGPLTGNELSIKMGIPGQWKRCSELKKKGLVTEVGERVCTVTERNCIIWGVTSNPPTPAEPKPTNKKPTNKQLVLKLSEKVSEMIGLIDRQRLTTHREPGPVVQKWLDDTKEILQHVKG